MQDFQVIRELRESEESSSWTRSVVAKDPENDGLVIVTHLNKEKFIKRYTYVQNPNELTESDHTALSEKAIAKYKLETERFISINKKVVGLKHPNIVTVISVGKEENTGDAIVVRDFFTGSHLFEITEGMTVEGMLPIFLGMIEAVDFIHQNDLLHLGLKPRRVRVVEDANGYSVKLTDFGYAAHINSVHDGTYGVAPFSAPEIILKEKKNIGVTSDLYSLGAIMYYCIARGLPFPAREGVKELARLTDNVNEEDEPMKPSERNPAILNVPHVGGINYKKDPEKIGQLEEIIMGLIKKDVTERPCATCKELYEQIVAIFPGSVNVKSISSATLTMSK